MRRVIQFSTGNVGRHSLRAIIGRPDLELVGVHAASSEKIGRDAADLCGLDQPTGIIATDDVDALVDLGADCVVYTSQGETRPMEAIDQIANFLAAGTNVVGSSMVWLVAPHHAEDWLRVPLERACEAGNTSLYVNGIDPGFSGDTLVHSAVSLSTRVSSITVQEIFDYGNYDDAEFTGAGMGFGMTPDDDTPMLLPARGCCVDVGRPGAPSGGPSRHRTRRSAPAHRTLVHARAYRLHNDDGGARTDGRGSVCRRGRPRRQTGDHHRARL